MQSTDKSIKPLWDYFASLLLGIGLCFWIPRINVVFRLAGITTINQEMEETMSVLGGSLFLLGSLWITPRLVFWLGAQVHLAREVPGLHD